MILTICNVTEALALLNQYTGLSPPRRTLPMTEKFYTIQLEHKHKPGRRYYLDKDMCLSNTAKFAKPLSLEAARAALTHAEALAGLLGEEGRDMEARIVEMVDPYDEEPGHGG